MIETMNTNIGEDKIGGLPDSIIHQIYSHLPTLYLVRSSILSKTWKDLWRSTPYLHFGLGEFGLCRSQFFQFINSVLKNRDGSNIQHLFLSYYHQYHQYYPYNLCHKYHPYVEECILYAVSHNVQVLSIDREYVEHPLPSSLFDCSSLVELTSNVPRLTTTGAWTGLPHLKKLHIFPIVFVEDDDVYFVEALISGCPLLENLTMNMCLCDCQEEYFSIRAFNLKKLILTSSGFTSLKVFAPSLLQLELKQHVYADEIGYNFSHCELNVPSLVDASLQMCSHTKSLALQVVKFLDNAQSLKLSCDCVSRSMKEDEEDFVEDNREEDLLEQSLPLFSKLKFMKLVNNTSIPVITALLNRSPNIETLVVDFNWKVGCGPTYSVSMLNYLKLVEIYGFGGFDDQVKFLRILIEKAVILEKIIIYYKDWEQLAQHSFELFTCPRASSYVKIVFQLTKVVRHNTW